MNNIFGGIILSYTRAEAIADGVLIDVTDSAKQVGFKIPVAVTSELWSKINNIPEEHSYQNIKGRLLDVLFMAALNSKMCNVSELKYKITMHHEIETEEGREIQEDILLKAVIGPGDNFEPVYTIMLPHED